MAYIAFPAHSAQSDLDYNVQVSVTPAGIRVGNHAFVHFYYHGLCPRTYSSSPGNHCNILVIHNVISQVFTFFNYFHCHSFRKWAWLDSWSIRASTICDWHSRIPSGSSISALSSVNSTTILWTKVRILEIYILLISLYFQLWASTCKLRASSNYLIHLSVHFCWLNKVHLLWFFRFLFWGFGCFDILDAMS